VWRSIQERTFTGRSHRMFPRRFQSPREAQAFTEQMLALRTSLEAGRVHLLEAKHEWEQLPRVVQVLNVPMSA
jgi:hypothetical protein